MLYLIQDERSTNPEKPMRLSAPEKGKTMKANVHIGRKIEEKEKIEDIPLSGFSANHGMIQLHFQDCEKHITVFANIPVGEFTRIANIINIAEKE